MTELNATEILADIDMILDQHYAASDNTKSLMSDRVMALCLADVIFASLFYLGNQNYPEIDQENLDYLLSKEPSLAACEWTGFYELRQGDPMAKVQKSMLRAEEEAQINLADWIQSDAELALCCWRLAQHIAKNSHWVQGDFAYDCLVVVGLMPMYEWFEHPKACFACVRGALCKD